MPNNTPYNSAFSRALKLILFDGKFTVKELASVIDVSERHLYNFAAGESNLELEKVEKLSRYFRSHNERRHLNGMIDDLDEIRRVTYLNHRPNGSLDDENAEITKALGKLIECFDNHDTPDSMEKAIVRASRALDGMKSELSNRKARE